MCRVAPWLWQNGRLEDLKLIIRIGPFIGNKSKTLSLADGRNELISPLKPGFLYIFLYAI